eukprot:TRINITY_DN9579_c0_g1_i1.p1 TRINITY_DN9579_c0_g1~~TRINITY_DN9579_c0_g1_i1.p1  ORF type:complete len:765 (-),score=187.63 TRINITY_DN9579_c0_g1_i1:82-2376(-)
MSNVIEQQEPGAPGESKEGFASDKPPSFHEWQDVNDLLEKAFADMELGQMIQLPGFGLYEAMSAIEIMDPKMDSGIGAETVRTLPELKELGEIEEDLTIPQVLSIMDKLLCLEVMWYSGFSLAQTLFTCLHLHSPKTIKHPHLKTFIISLLKTCFVIRTLVLRADVHEEEDFIASCFGFTLCPDISEEVCLTDLKDIETLLEKQIRKSQGKAEPEDGTVEPLQKDETKETEYCEALLARLRFRREFYMLNLHLNKNECKGIDLARESLKISVAQIDKIKNTTKLYDGIESPKGAFDSKVCRRMPVPVPPRDLPVVELDAALDFFKKMFTETEKLFELPKYDTLENLVLYVNEISSSSPDIVTRSRMKVMTYHEGKIFGQIEVTKLIKDDMTKYALPDLLLGHVLVQPFLQKLANMAIGHLKILCHNHARQKRKFGSSFEEWRNIAREAEVLDHVLDQQNALQKPEPKRKVKRRTAEDNSRKWIFFFTVWTIHLTSFSMVSFLTRGFGLELYNKNEYCMLYWYLDYILGMRTKNRQDVKQQLLQIEKLKAKHAPQPRKPAAGRGRNKKPANQPSTPKPEESTQEITIEQLLTEAQTHISKGLFRFIVAACHYQSYDIFKDPGTFGSMENRFFSRFGAFRKLYQPQPLTYKHFETVQQWLKYEPIGLFRLAIESFTEAKKNLEKIVKHTGSPPEFIVNEARTMAKVVISNSIGLEMLVKEITTSGRKKENQKKIINYNFAVHTVYPIISLAPNPDAPKEPATPQKQ